ncbi:hypothetical protein EZ428_11865 [Pedobacter frigiditerrae]|uniref:Uncharacterized protein n=1 Tax=Pedobacter frigiditerrae TaxID=2530452 RepID=A0A4R0MYJ9_9SPHI|nr:hypothetical protein [Pedobacter frigiditerrae]TCC92409.1 hypothetical protein EZ428_11865 [Pedobacter frigiditerrae]
MTELMIRCMRLWGGRYNPIIPTSGNSISDEWKNFMGRFDPDYIYYGENISLDFVLGIIDELKFNPIELLSLKEERNNFKGVNSKYLLPILRDPHTFFKASSIWDWDSPLKEYYQFNYLLDESHFFEDNLLGKHQLVTISKDNIGNLDKLLHEQRVTNYSYLSTVNISPLILRPQGSVFRAFELVIADKNNCFQELIYHWNKKCFEIGYQILASLFITVEQLEELIKTEWFKQTLFDHSGNENRIDIVSFSLSGEETEIIRAKLQDYTVHSKFVITQPFQFPFDIMDESGRSDLKSKERQAIQVNSSTEYFINLPVLSFHKDFYSNTQQYAIEIDVSEISKGKRNNRRFPTNTKAEYFFRGAGRIDKSRRLVALVDETIHEKAILDFNNVDFFKNVEQVVTSPRIINKRDQRIYSDCAYNDGSNRLLQFLGLFENSFLLIEDFLHDKFWNDLFLELTNNAKVEGDTITFDELYERCYALMVQQGIQFGEHPETRINVDNLKLGLKSTLQGLAENKVFLIGYNSKCKKCSSKIWYSLAEITNMTICKGCSNENYFTIETPISYKLNHLVKNNYGMKSEKGVFVPDGNLTAINTLLYLYNRSRAGNFEYLPQIDVYEDHKAGKPKTDLDVVSMVNGKLYIGECKHSSPLFFESSNKSLDNLLTLASTIKPDKIIISCTVDSHNKLDKAVKYLKHGVSKWINKPEIIGYLTHEPTYQWPNNFRYFYH